MTDVYRNEFETSKGRTLEKEPVIGIAVADAAHADKWDGGGYIRAVPLTLSTVTDNRNNAFGAPAASLADDERVVGCLPASGMWAVRWVPDKDSEYDITHLGYEYDGATCYNWDWVIEQVKDEDSRWSE